MALQQKITVKWWDMNKGMGKASTAEELNIYLEEIRQGVRKSYKELKVRRKVIIAELVKSYLAWDMIPPIDFRNMLYNKFKVSCYLAE